MGKWQKIGAATAMGAAITTSIHCINKIITSNAVSDNLFFKKNNLIYKWKFGNIAYNVSGSGECVLLVHDMMSWNSSIEWYKIINILSKHYTVYLIDLLGSGASDKPSITYTAYMYTQLILDFTKDVINNKTSIIATGHSAPFCILTMYSNPNYFNKLILVNPEAISKANIYPKKNITFLRKLYNCPVFGTLIYNIKYSRQEIKNNFKQCYFSPKANIDDTYFNYCYEGAHLKDCNGKYLSTSILFNYTSSCIKNAIGEIDNSIFIISGTDNNEGNEIIKEYQSLNPAIECKSIINSKHFPQIENPTEFLRAVLLYLA